MICGAKHGYHGGEVRSIAIAGTRKMANGEHTPRRPI